MSGPYSSFDSGGDGVTQTLLNNKVDKSSVVSSITSSNLASTNLVTEGGILNFVNTELTQNTHNHIIDQISENKFGINLNLMSAEFSLQVGDAGWSVTPVEIPDPNITYLQQVAIEDTAQLKIIRNQTDGYEYIYTPSKIQQLALPSNSPWLQNLPVNVNVIHANALTGFIYVLGLTATELDINWSIPIQTKVADDSWTGVSYAIPNNHRVLAYDHNTKGVCVLVRSTDTTVYSNSSLSWFNFNSLKGFTSTEIEAHTHNNILNFKDDIKISHINNSTNKISIGYQAGQTEQGNSSVAVGYNAGRQSQGSNSVAVGLQAGSTSQGFNSVAIGYNAGRQSQGINSVAIGLQAGSVSQQSYAVAIGNEAGIQFQGVNTVAIGSGAGQISQAIYGIALGYRAGAQSQGAGAVAIGGSAGRTKQGSNSVAVGSNAGETSQANNSVAVGYRAGQNEQGDSSVAVGVDAGAQSQGDRCVAVGNAAGRTQQGNNAIALGYRSGRQSQGTNAVAIGHEAGQVEQGNNSVAIGAFAGATTSQPRTIVLNGSGSDLSTNGTDRFFVKPIRDESVLTGLTQLYYNPTTGEITYN